MENNTSVLLILLKETNGKKKAMNSANHATSHYKKHIIKNFTVIFLHIFDTVILQTFTVLVTDFLQENLESKNITQDARKFHFYSRPIFL